MRAGPAQHGAAVQLRKACAPVTAATASSSSGIGSGNGPCCSAGACASSRISRLSSTAALWTFNLQVSWQGGSLPGLLPGGCRQDGLAFVCRSESNETGSREANTI